MLINECRPYVNRAGELRFIMPGFRRSVAGISPWRRGFVPCQIRNGRQQDSSHWSVTLFSARGGRRLAGSVEAFLNEIPLEVRERVGRYRFGQVPMLQCISSFPEAGDLCRSNPALFWLMVASTFDSERSVQDLQGICRLRQVEILREINGRASKATVRLMHKIHVDEGTLGEARNILRALFVPDIVRVAAHQARVPVRYLALLANYPDLAEPAAANVVARILGSEAGQGMGTAVDLAVQLIDIKRMARALNIPRPERTIAGLKSLEDVARLHDRWVDNLNAAPRTPEEEHNEIVDVFERARRERELPAFLRQVDDRRPQRNRGQRDLDEIAEALLRRRAIIEQSREDLAALEFPAPPFPDSPHIRAITSAEELIREGRVQDNCVATYARHVASGDLYVYRVTRPERGTLELRQRDGAWVLGQFKLKRNRRPSHRSTRFVRQWFDAVRWNP
ncbi:MAG: PcfJ domain-containing protein [Gammaproteobacteria bacterium]|nr:PcfJ domain-containing protein [Gammaproteobacteria bacterium]